MSPYNARLDWLARLAGADGPGGHGLGDDGAGADDGAFADGDAGGEEAFGAEPGVVAYGDGEGVKLEALALVVVGAGAEVDALGDDDSSAQGDGRHWSSR